MRASKLCNEPGCPELIPGSVSASYCPAHLLPAAHGWDSSTRTRPEAWRRIRASVLSRARHRCALCGRPANTVDHLDPAGLGRG